MLLWITEGPKPVIKERYSDHIVDSAINYLDIKNIERKYSPLKLMTDSGAYTATRKGISLDPYKILEIQEKLRSDIYVPLDYPFTAEMTISEIQDRWKKTIENTRLWVEALNRKKDVMPIVHALGQQNLYETVKILSNIAGNADYMGFGTIMFTKDDIKGYLGDRRLSISFINALMEFIKVVKEEYGFKVHIAGFGSSPLTLYLAIYLGIDSVDSSGFRRRAAYGKILLPGKGERYVGRGDARFGITKLSSEDLQQIKECDCPICRTDPSLLWKSWRARAIHNEWVLKKTWLEGIRMARKDIEAYERYLDGIFEKSSLRYIWKYIKTNYRRIY